MANRGPYIREPSARAVDPVRHAIRIGIWAVVAAHVHISLAIAEDAMASLDDRVSEIRTLVEHNEALARTIMYRYSVNLDSDPGITSVRMAPGLRAGSQTHPDLAEGTWAQDGPRFHDSVEFLAKKTFQRGYVSACNGEVLKWGVKPDFMQGAVSSPESADFLINYALRLGLRPFDTKVTLSQALRPDYVLRVSERTEGDRPVYVVDIHGPSGGWGRFWIDKDRGSPLRIYYYDADPAAEGSLIQTRIEEIRLEHLSNGGWLPVEGIVYSEGGPGHERPVLTARVTVDVKSITIKREDLPDSLFDITFPAGARVADNILGIVHGVGGTGDEYLKETAMDAISSFSEPGADRYTATAHQEGAPASQEAVHDPASVEAADASQSGPATGWAGTVLIFLAATIATIALIGYLAMRKRSSRARHV